MKENQISWITGTPAKMRKFWKEKVIVGAKYPRQYFCDFMHDRQKENLLVVKSAYFREVRKFESEIFLMSILLRVSRM